MFPDDILRLAEQVIERLTMRGQMVVTAESCTGGLIAGALTSVSGSSSAVFGGFVTYANEAKSGMIGVPAEMIADFGAVSEPVAKAMAVGALAESEADITISVTGVAGPNGGTAQKPVGLVHFGCAMGDRVSHDRILFADEGREAIRLATVRHALEMLLTRLTD